MWSAVVDERVLHFEMIARNNQNFVMRDEETGTWWQQSSGRALLGPLAGKRLELVPFEHVSFGVWKAEHPHGKVLLPVDGDRDRYAPERWADRMRSIPPVTPVDPEEPLGPKELVVGLEIGTRAKAYPMEKLLDQAPIADRIGSREIVLVVGPDEKSVRCFDRSLDGEPLELFARPGTEPPLLVDTRTGSAWSFDGIAISGPLAGRRLERLQTIEGFWFDWKRNHPETRLYER